MKNSTLALLIALLLPVSLWAQTDTLSEPVSKKIRYFNYISSGILLAKKGTGPSFSTTMIHGIRKGALSAGAGIGYDTYLEWRVVPLIAHIGFDLVKERLSAISVLLQGGYSLARYVPLSSYSAEDYDYKKGWTFHPQVGYRLEKENISLYFMAGYKFQRLDYGTRSWWWAEGYSRNVKREMERVSVHIGVGLH